MSRTAAIRQLNRGEVRRFLEDAGVHLISGGLDEAPMAYKDIHAVMAAQSDLVDIVARFEPRLVKMAPDEGSHAKGWGKKKQQDSL
jgi:tRNA-splicing ligase RtcB